MKFELKVTYMTNDNSLSEECNKIIYIPSEKDLEVIKNAIKYCDENDSVLTVNTLCSGHVELKTRVSDIYEDESKEEYEDFEDEHLYDSPLLVISSTGSCLQFYSKYGGDMFESDNFMI